MEHLGQYVFEMTQAKVEMLKKGESVLPLQETGDSIIEDEEMDAESGEVKMEEAPDLDKSELDEIT